MEIPFYQVDAFTSHVFGGNPAAVCPLESWLPDELLQSIALENNLSETAFFVREMGRYHLRWFTPTVEVDLCGHATLASAHVIFEELNDEQPVLLFDSLSGELQVERTSEGLRLDFPARLATPRSAPAELLEAMGEPAPQEVFEGPYWLIVYEDEASLRRLSPDFSALASMNPVIATAPGTQVDFLSRFFAPNCGVDEDPVTGSAHCTLTPYWSERLGKTLLRAQQISQRGGELLCEHRGHRTWITGKSVVYLRGKITI